MRQLCFLACALVSCSSDRETPETVGSSSAALQADIGGTRSLGGATVVDTPIGVPPGGGINPPGGPVGFCYFTQIVGAFVKDTDYIKIDIDNKVTGAVWALYQSGGPASPYATIHCISLDTFTGLDPATYTTTRVGPGTAVQTGPTELLIGASPEWPGVPPAMIPSNFNVMGWINGHMTSAKSAAWLYLGASFGPDPGAQHQRGGCYVDEDPAPASGCGGACSLTGNCWSFGGNKWIAFTHYGVLGGNFVNSILPGTSSTAEVCGLAGITGDWASPTTSVSVTTLGANWVVNASTGGGAGEQFLWFCYPLAQ